MTRILHMIPGLTGGGAERQLTILAGAQAEHGHTVTIAALRPEFPESLKQAGVHFHLLQANGHHDPLLLARVHSLFRKFRPEIVQTWLTLPDVVGGSVALMTGTPWILSERSAGASYVPTWKNRARARLARNSSAIIANSPGGAEYWASQGIAASRTVIIPNAVEIPPPQPGDSDAFPPAITDRPLVLFVGRLSAEKNPIVLIDALARTLPSSNAIALVCGTGAMEAEVIARIKSHNMTDRILLAGYRSDVPALLRRAQVCVAISTHEGHPNAVLEAIAIGCPLVVSDIPAYTSIVDKAGATIVPLNDVPATADGISAILADPAAAASRAQALRTRVALPSARDLAGAHDRVYESLLRTA